MIVCILLVVTPKSATLGKDTVVTISVIEGSGNLAICYAFGQANILLLQQLPLIFPHHLHWFRDL